MGGRARYNHTREGKCEEEAVPIEPGRGWAREVEKLRRRLAGIARIWLDWRRRGAGPPRASGSLETLGREGTRQQSHARPTGGRRSEGKADGTHVARGGLARAEGGQGGRERSEIWAGFQIFPARCGAAAAGLVRPGICREAGASGKALGKPKYLGLSGSKKRGGGVFQLGPRRPPSPRHPPPDSRAGQQQHASDTIRSDPIRPRPAGRLAEAGI